MRKNNLTAILLMFLFLIGTLSASAQVEVGDIITFGSYEQDNDPANGAEPIEWQVLAVEDGRALLISRYALDAKPYNLTRTGVTWETCSLRSWLNGEFYNTAFSPAEQTQIAEITLRNPENPNYGTSSGFSTVDRIFLLNIDEAEEYFADDTARACEATAHAKANGTYVSINGNPWWWLRSPGRYSNFAARVDIPGYVDTHGYTVRSTSGAVRPAFWLELSGDSEPAEEADVPQGDVTQEAEEQASEVSSASLDIQTGDIITFGSYEQDNDLSNGAEPIEWQVLAVEDGRALVISRYGLDAQPYNSSLTSETWKTCSLRAWLNGEFYDTAFSSGEQARITQVTLQEGTEDRIFLLSMDEVRMYFTDEAERDCLLTAYSKAQGDESFDVIQWLLTADSQDFGDKAARWWLRSSGYYNSKTAYVYDGDSVRSSRLMLLTARCAVRPAFWLELSGDSEPVKVVEYPQTEVPETMEEQAVEEIAAFSDLQAGDIITFGSYEQDNDLSNGPEPIEWQVLAVADGHALVISKYALDAKPYNTTSVDVTWETCSLRTWLNGAFYNTAFCSAEREQITEVTLQNLDNSQKETPGGLSTKDRIFLLSIDEFVLSFSGDAERSCEATAYAKAKGAYVISGNSRWWLRSPGYHSDDAVLVIDTGRVYMMGIDVSSTSCAVRPAFLLDLSGNSEHEVSLDVQPAEAMQSVEDQTAEEPSALLNLQTGDIITFGNYEQDNDRSNGAEPIEWQVLAVEDGRALVVSRYALDTEPYNNTTRENVTWETCTLRKWLNWDFYNRAFTLSEKSQILQVTLENPNNLIWGTKGGNCTMDKIFLLSTDEARMYFPDDAARVCEATAYTKAQGAFVHKDSGYSWWWLRSPSYYSNIAADVDYTGFINDFLGDFVTSQGRYSSGTVRPAFWLDLLP